MNTFEKLDRSNKVIGEHQDMYDNKVVDGLTGDVSVNDPNGQIIGPFVMGKMIIRRRVER